MTARLRVGVLGLSHDHVWGNLAAVATGEVGRLVAVAEPSPALRERLGREHAGVAHHPTYEALLERSDLDAVLVFADNRAAAELGVRALGRDLPVLVEKPMAANLEGAEVLLAAARRRGIGYTGSMNARSSTRMQPLSSARRRFSTLSGSRPRRSRYCS
jgi:predicted dehydrogenase